MNDRNVEFPLQPVSLLNNMMFSEACVGCRK
jgi:hypothetical protein